MSERLPSEHLQNGDTIRSSLFPDDESSTNDHREARATDPSLGHGTVDGEFTTITNVSAEGIRRKSTFEVEETDAFSASLNTATNGSVSGDTPGGDYGDVLIPVENKEDVSIVTNDFPPTEIPDQVDTTPKSQPIKKAASGDYDLPDFLRFSKHGTILTEDEQRRVAEARGVCITCGRVTHDVKVFSRKPIENEHVHNGICLICNPEGRSMSTLTNNPPTVTPVQVEDSVSRNDATKGSVSGDTPGGHDELIPVDTNHLLPPTVIHVPDDTPPEPQPKNNGGFLQEFRIIPYLFTVGVIVAGLATVLILLFKPDSPPPTLEPTKEIVLCLSPDRCKYKFLEKLDEMETELYLFRDEIERVHALSCDERMLNCSKNNYNECDSVYPDKQCVCGNVILKDHTCDARWETSSHTAVRIPVVRYEADKMDRKVVESVCITRLAEPYMIDSWIDMNFTANQVYFGSKMGSFRIIPAAYSEWCYNEPYDPRYRSWYIAAASGKKDVILLIGESMESMDLVSARHVVKTILKSLTLKDRVAIVAFSDKAWLLGDETRLVRATSENKDKLERAIDNLAADGNSTNFYDAFQTAFNAWDNTTSDEDNLVEDNYEGSYLAVLFLTDGQNSYKDITSATIDEENEKVMAFINQKMEQIENGPGVIATTIFTFSFGDNADKNMSKTFACGTGGFWQHVEQVEEGDELFTALSSYYEWYALWLVEEDGDEDLAVWVPEYTFASSGKNGTTVSVPVYDRSVSPPIFLGVAAMDVYMEDLNVILGNETQVTELLQDHISKAKSPSFSMRNEIDLDMLRFRLGGEEATCGDSNFTQFNSTGTCDEGNLPKELFGDTISNFDLVPDIERICCECQ